MLTRWRVATLVAIGIVLASAQVDAHQNRVRLPLSSNTCRDGSPERIWVVNGADATDCSTGGNTFEVECCCIDGTWDQCPGGTSSGSSDSFKTHATPSGTSPVADSATDTLNWTAGAGITITGDSATDTITIASTAGAITLDLGDDGGNDSTALAEIAVVNDNGGAFTEPSADKLSIDVAKLRPASLDNPRGSAASSYDDEFNSGTLDPKWTITSSGTTNPATSGSVNPTSSLTTPIVDVSTQAGWLLMQSDNSSVKMAGVYETISLDTNASILVKLQAANGVLGSADEGDLALMLWNSSDSNETLTIGEIQQASAGYAHQITVQNNAVFTSVIGTAGSDKWAAGPVYALLWKVSNVYHAMFARGESGVFLYLGSVTKTGVTTFDRLSLVQYTANETPSIIGGFDFVRYYSSNTIAVVNE